MIRSTTYRKLAGEMLLVRIWCRVKVGHFLRIFSTCLGFFFIFPFLTGKEWTTNLGTGTHRKENFTTVPELVSILFYDDGKGHHVAILDLDLFLEFFFLKKKFFFEIIRIESSDQLF